MLVGILLSSVSFVRGADPSQTIDMETHFQESSDSSGGSIFAWSLFCMVNIVIMCAFYQKRRDIISFFSGKASLQKEYESLQEENSKLKKRLVDGSSSADTSDEDRRSIEISTAEVQKLRREKEELENELHNAQVEVTSLKSKTKSQENEKSALQKKLDDANSKNQELTSKHQATVHQLEEARTEVANLRKQLERKENEEEERRQLKEEKKKQKEATSVSHQPLKQVTDAEQQTDKTFPEVSQESSQKEEEQAVVVEENNEDLKDLVAELNLPEDQSVDSQNDTTSSSLAEQLGLNDDIATTEDNEISQVSENNSDLRDLLAHDLNMSNDRPDSPRTTPALSLDLPDEVDELIEKRNSLRIPKDLQLEEEPAVEVAPKKERTEEEFEFGTGLDLSKIRKMKGMRATTKEKTSSRKFDLAGLEDWSGGSGSFSKNQKVDDLKLNDETDDLMALLDKKAKEQSQDPPSSLQDLLANTQMPEEFPTNFKVNSKKKPLSTWSPSKTSPAQAHRLLDLFKQPTDEETSADTSSSHHGNQSDTTQWSTGEAVIKAVSVKEDMNKRGMRKTKKKNPFGTGSALEMEDAHLVQFPFHTPSQGIFGVFDGHAGKNCALAAVDKFPTELESRFDPSLTDLSDVLKETYLKLDSELIEYEYEGCTATTVIVWQSGEDRYLQCANVGDSSAFLKRGETVLKISKDHKPTDSDERDRIIASGVDLGENQTRVGGLAVSRALGDHFLKQEKLGVVGEPYVSPSIRLEPTDTILIVASDGLWDVITGERAMDICSSLGSADAMARELLAAALADPKCTDNTTVMVVLL